MSQARLPFVTSFLSRLEGPRFGNHMIVSLLFADDVVTLASAGQDLQCALGPFAGEWESDGKRISTSKSDVMALD